jgi:hypothetical protein
MGDLIPSSYVRVTYQFNGKQKSVYLEQHRIITTPPLGGSTQMVTGYECNKQGESKIYKGGSILHLIQLGEGVTVIPQLQSKMYGDLHDA